MKISYNWLKELTGVDWPVDQMADRLTLCGTACEDTEATARYMDKVVVGEVVDVRPIKGADKIRQATVDVGDRKIDLVCGAPNLAKGQRVPVALEGAKLAGDIVVRKAKIRGVESSAMICSERELGISEDHSGIMVLDRQAKLGQALVEHLDYDDYIMDFELTPNRADSTCAIGIARDLAALARTKVNYPSFELKESKEKVNDLFAIEIEDRDACPRFTARIIKGVKVGPSPWWIQKKLLTAGVRPISNVVDISNLVMLESGNPMHAFDLDRLGSDKIVVRRAKDKEKFTTLDGEERTLTSEILMITNGERAVGVAGIMGGMDSEVEDSTKDILLEVAYFDPTVIRRGRKHLGMVTEASTRFEKGVDPNNVDRASARAAALFAEICGGEVLSGVVDCYPKKISPVTIDFRPDKCNELLGANFTTERMSEIFTDLELTVSEGHPLKIEVPTFRPDLTREVDLIEEIARIEGYDAIPDAVSNIGPLFSPIHDRDKQQNELRQLMVGTGFDEMLGHGLADSKQAAILSDSLPQLNIVNPVSEELNIMRNDLALSALNVIAHNHAHRIMDLRLFEIGKAYFPPDAKGDWLEDNRLLLAVSGATAAGWRDHPRPMDFHDLAGGLEVIASHFGYEPFDYRPAKHSYLAEGHCFEIYSADRSVGQIGMVDAAIARKFEIKQPVFLAQLSLRILFEKKPPLTEFQPLPVYPASSRDIAILVDRTVQVGQLKNLVTDIAGELAEAVEIFDLYEGKQIGEGKKSVGVSITYRFPDRSPDSKEIDDIQTKIVSSLKDRLKAEIRDK